MHSTLRQLVSFTIVPMVALAGTCNAQAPLPGTDIRSYLTADISSKLSLGGTWIPIDTNAALIGPFWNVVKLGPSQREGVALGGWGFNGSFTSANPDVTPVRSAILEQQSDGTLIDATTRLLVNPVTNGAGSVIVADFNGDGLDDVVFPAHNESPFLYKHSTAWISRAGGGFDKLILADEVMNHDARLVTLDGRKKIFSRSFGGSGNNGQGAGFNVIYSWNGSTLAADTSLGDLGGMSINAGAFSGNSDNWLIVGDSASGAGIPWSPSNPMLNYAYKYNAGVLTLPPVPLPKPYFNDKPAYAGFKSFWDPASKTHTSRLWTTDLNQDGLPDILAGQELWSAGPEGLQKAVFQLLVNHGNMAFTDDTDALAPEYNKDSYIDYSVRFADVDASGIETMFHSSNVAFSDAVDAARQGQYVLVNDGTGRLYAAMHDEFRAMRTQVVGFFNRSLPAGGASTALTPQFIAYRNATGKLNFVAVVKYFVPNVTPNTRFGFVNVALEINLATDFRRDLTIATRNGSKRIRTFAGNDTIRRVVSDPDCAIDGGLGTNTAVYPGSRSAWTITKTSGGITVRPASGPGGTDTLTRIQRAQFDDQTVDLASLPVTVASNYSALWWNPAESGWGINFNHQGNIVFGTLFTYDAAGTPMWLVLAAGALQSGTTYSGDLYRTTGPAFNANPFTPISDANLTRVGTMTVTFSGDAATLTYTVNGTSVTKAIQKQVFGTAAASCTPTTASRAALTNYQDLWWNPAESGWGLNIAHQGNTLFGALFTYAASGNGLWLVMSAGLKQADGSYLGDLYQTTGPAFNAIPFTPIGAANVTKVGTMQLRFSDGQTGTLNYTVNGAIVTKQITRQVFSSPVFACN